jgi:hypothetical protein
MDLEKYQKEVLKAKELEKMNFRPYGVLIETADGKIYCVAGMHAGLEDTSVGLAIQGQTGSFPIGIIANLRVLSVEEMASEIGYLLHTLKQIGDVANQNNETIRSLDEGARKWK